MSTEPEIWRRLPFNQSSAGRQLALSESLIAELRAPSLYWYGASRPALILGAAQKPEIIDMDAARAESFEVYKRTSGGTVVLAGPDFLSLDVVLPPASLLASSDVTRAYLWFGRAWVAALARFGIAARLVEPEEARQARLQLEAAPPDEKLVKLVCFGTLSSYEVVGPDGRKLVGLAQIKRRSGSLLQAGIHLRWPAETFARLLKLEAGQRSILAEGLAQRATGLSELLGYRPSNEDIIAALEESLLTSWPVTFRSGEWSDSELAQADKLEQEKFGNLLETKTYE